MIFHISGALGSFFYIMQGQRTLLSYWLARWRLSCTCVLLGRTRGSFIYRFVLISPAIISKLLPSGCKSMKSSIAPLLPSGSVLRSPWSGVIPTMRTFIGGLTVSRVTSWSLPPGLDIIGLREPDGHTNGSNFPDTDP